VGIDQGGNIWEELSEIFTEGDLSQWDHRNPSFLHFQISYKYLSNIVNKVTNTRFCNWAGKGNAPKGWMYFEHLITAEPVATPDWVNPSVSISVSSQDLLQGEQWGSRILQPVCVCVSTCGTNFLPRGVLVRTVLQSIFVPEWRPRVGCGHSPGSGWDPV
jgi:hypothetical protein